MSSLHLTTSKAYIAQQENKCRELEGSNRILKSKTHILEDK